MRRRDVLRTVGGAGLVSTGFAGATAASTRFASSGRSSSYDEDATDDDPDGDRNYPAGQPTRDDPQAYDDYTVRRVPDEYDTIQAAVDDAEPRDLVLVGPGVYREAVRVTETPRLTIRGTSRNDVVLDGEFEREDAIYASANDVVMENMTARHYRRNAFFWNDVEGYRGSYLTAYNNRLYGVYAFDSIHGRFDNSYASGHTDSGFYVGQCEPCHAIVEHVIAENNAIGYSGTNAGGYLTIRNSIWRHNMGGIVPNSLDSESNPPQEAARIENNLVEANNNADAPDAAFGYAAFGTGINVAGGRDNVVVHNRVLDHANFGIVTVPMIDDNLYRPANNRFERNTVSGSGRADLALGAPQAGGNVFIDNRAGTARPAGLVDDATPRVGDPWVTMLLVEQFLQLEQGESPHGDWRDQPDPPFDSLDGMPDPETKPPREAVRRDA